MSTAHAHRWLGAGARAVRLRRPRRAVAAVAVCGGLLAGCADPPVLPSQAVCDTIGARADDPGDFPRFPGDGGQSIQLPDGRVLWLLGDSVLSDGKIIRNLAYVQDAAGGGCFRPLVGPERTAVLPGHGDRWYWPTDAVVDGEVLRVYAHEVGPDPSADGVALDFTVVDMDVAVFSLPDLRLLRMEELPPTGDVLYGNMAEGRYVFGARQTEGFIDGHELFVARTGYPWHFWDGGGWNLDPASAAPILTGAEPGSVDTATGQWRITGKVKSFLTSDIATWTGPNPWGPFTKTVVATVPPLGEGEFSYLATSHPEQRLADGRLLVSWNLNSMTGAPVAYGLHYTSVPSG